MFLKLFYILISGIPSILLMANKPFNQIHLFMQNKPNFQKPKKNLSLLKAKTYENKTLGGRGKNKPNQTQFFKQSYQLMLLHSKYLKKTRGKFREKKPNQPQLRIRAFFTQSSHLSHPFRTISTYFKPFRTPFRTISHHSALALQLISYNFAPHFLPFQTTNEKFSSPIQPEYRTS